MRCVLLAALVVSVGSSFAETCVAIDRVKALGIVAGLADTRRAPMASAKQPIPLPDIFEISPARVIDREGLVVDIEAQWSGFWR
jgi:hypothetical protein